MEEIQKENALQYMLMVYLGENRWAKMAPGGGSFGARSPNPKPLGDFAAVAAGMERRRAR
jgi:hypothetical protein